MQEREGRESGLRLTYRLIDAEAARARRRRPAGRCSTGRSGWGSTASTSPTRSSRRCCRCSTSCPTTPPTWARSTPWSSATVAGSAATPTGPATRRAFRTALPDAVAGPGRRWSAPAAPGPRSATACSTRAPSTSRCSTPTRTGRDACAVRLAKRYGDDAGHARRPTCRAALAEAAGRRQRHPGRDARPPGHGRSRRTWSRPDLWVSDVVYFPLETELVALARVARLPGACPAAGWRCTRRSARSSTSPAGPRTPSGCVAALRGADRRMRRGIATVSLSGAARRQARRRSRRPASTGSRSSTTTWSPRRCRPREVARRCADLGLSIDLFQPVRDVEGVPPERFDAVLHRFRTKLDVMAELGAARCWPAPTSPPTPSTTSTSPAEQLHRLGDARRPSTASRSPSRRWPGAGTSTGVGQAWDAVAAPTTRP